jgi:hypothetical protein
MDKLVVVLLWEAQVISEQNALVLAGSAQATSFEQKCGGYGSALAECREFGRFNSRYVFIFTT